MIPDRWSRSARWRARAISGERLTLLLIAVSILGGIALAIACSYRPIALWWVMVGGSAINLVRLGARLSEQSRADRPPGSVAHSRLAAVLSRALSRSVDAFARGASGPSKASLDRQHTRFLVWFTEHNLLWTAIGFGLSLLLWHRFGPTTPTLVVMAALMSCGLFAVLGAAAGASAPILGLCWREPCKTPDLRTLRRIVHDIGCVVVLTNRRDYAAQRDWAKGGRFHELFLTVDDLARAGVEPGLEAVLTAEDATARRALARKERLDRAVALTPVFAAGILAALFAVPPLAGSEPLPSLWTIVTRNANAPDRTSASNDDSRDLPSGSTTSSGSRETQKQAGDRSGSRSPAQSNGEPTSSASRAGHERPDVTGRHGDSSITGDAVASASGDGAGAAGQGAARGGEGSGAESDSAGSGGGSSSGGDRSGGSGGRGGAPRGYGTDGVAPQRADSPGALPEAPVSPGKAIEVVLPAFSQARDDSPADDPMGTKRKAKASEEARPYQGRRETATVPNEAATRAPVQRLPNWIIQLLQK
jgi:hypothetical protein